MNRRIHDGTRPILPKKKERKAHDKVTFHDLMSGTLE